MNPPKPNILCISLTPALDHYMTLNNFEFGKINRCLHFADRAGGKSINGARAIQQVGGKPLVISALGGHRGNAIIDYAHKEGIDLLSICTESETRQYTEIWDGASQVSTYLSEQWSNVTPQEWISYIELINEQIRNNTKFDAAVIAGGLPPGVECEEIIPLVKIFMDAGISCFVDSAGDSLGPLLTARPTVVKINNNEASNYLGEGIESVQDAVKACKHFISQGIESCVITMGVQGAVGATKSAVYHVNINNKGLWPVGSGDSFLGAMAVKWAQGEPWLNTLIAGAAAGTANAHRRISGLLDMEIYEFGLKTAQFTQLS
jgi:1-phosphofructokinase family hexose kinase